ncbi:DHA2 family efflux MFS transporter permease subunit [Amphibiibacter pelophylacis]|uniref:DHA2 family efflux MFS transporter permease subunit n=1 Tax=Amphibiibacter pelophylacis TaxID=1799477 RepID=A0ACC6P2I6_9BURK
MSTPAQSVHEAAFNPPSRGIATMGLCLATFMQVLDTTIANVSLPTIAGNLGVSSGQSTWVITSFAVSTAIALPLTGYLTRRFGEVRLFIWATMLFSLASFLCGIATNMPELILFRALQGAVAGPMYPITQSLLISIYPPIKRGMALALLAMITVVAPIAGPILGGWITDNYSWEWIFFINVPIGLFASAVIAQQMRERRDPIETPKLDRMGLFLLVIGVGSLQIMLDLGNDADWFASPLIVALTLVSVVALTVFVIWELTHDDPIVNLTLFRKRNFLVGTIAMVMAYAAFFSMGLLVPLWLQRNLGYTSIWAGLATAPIGLLPILLTPVVGKYSSKVDLRLMASFAFVVMGLVSFMRSQFVVQVDFFHVALTQFIMGLGVAFFFMPMIQIMLSDLSPREIPGGSGLSTFLRTLGGSFSASITTFLWDERGVVHHAHLTESISAYNSQATATLPLLGATPTAQLAQANQLITQQAVQLGFNELFYALAWIFVGLILLLWFARPPFSAKAGPASAGH